MGNIEFEKAFRTILLGRQDHTVRHFKCKECNKTISTYECDRICIMGGGFLCCECNAVNMNSNIEFIK